VLGFRDVVLFFIVAVVSLRWIATAAAAGPSAMVVWLIAGLALFVPLAFTVVELSSRYPGEGGLYVWTGRAFGEFAGFMSAWMYWTSTVIYLPGLLYFAAGNLLFVGGGAWQGLSDQPLYYAGFSLAAIALGIGLNTIGLDLGTRLHNLGAWSTWAPAVALVLLGAVAWMRFGPATAFHPAALVPSTRIQDVYFWCTVAFAFGGLEGASLMGDEIRDPRRTVPRAVLAAGLMVAGIYLLGTAAVLAAIPAGEVSGLQGIMQAFQRMTRRVGLPGLAPPIALLITLGTVAGAAAWMAATARLLFVAGVDRFLPPALGRTHPRWGTPAAALAVQGVGAALVVLLGQMGASVRGAYDVLVSMGVITYFIPFLLMFAAMIRLQTEPAPEGTRRVPGGRPVATLLASLGLLTTAVSIVLAAFPPGEGGDRWVAAGKTIGASAFLILLGVALFARGQRRLRVV
jgi:amino acid transporter